MTRSETPIGDAVIPAPIVDTVAVAQPQTIDAGTTRAVGDHVTLNDGKSGTISRLDGSMFILADDQGDETHQHIENITA